MQPPLKVEGRSAKPRPHYHQLSFQIVVVMRAVIPTARSQIPTAMMTAARMSGTRSISGGPPPGHRRCSGDHRVAVVAVSVLLQFLIRAPSPTPVQERLSVQGHGVADLAPKLRGATLHHWARNFEPRMALRQKAHQDRESAF